MSSHKRRSYGYGARKFPKNIGKLGEAWAMALQIATASKAPIHEALVPAKLFEVGIGNLFFSRALPDGHIALGCFLLDVFCLGVKNAFVTIVARDEYAQRRRSCSTAESLQPMSAACFARGKLSSCSTSGIHAGRADSSTRPGRPSPDRRAVDSVRRRKTLVASSSGSARCQTAVETTWPEASTTYRCPTGQPM